MAHKLTDDELRIALAYGRDDFNALPEPPSPRWIRTAIACLALEISDRRAQVERLTAEREAASREVDRMRAVVDATRALSATWADSSGSHASVDAVAKAAQSVVRALHALAAKETP